MAELDLYGGARSLLLDAGLTHILETTSKELCNAMVCVLEAVSVKTSFISLSLYHFAFLSHDAVRLNACPPDREEELLLGYLAVLSLADDRLTEPLGQV